MEKHLKIQDTCGIHNLHAMPGLIGGIVGAITAAAATESVYGKEGWVVLKEYSEKKNCIFFFILNYEHRALSISVS